MRAITLFVSLLFFSSFLASGQHPVPPGMREAGKLPHPADVPPQLKPGSGQRQVDPAQLKREADELAKLAQSIPGEIEQIAGGRLPKDLNEQLKRIEKLSKNLRRQLSQ